MLPNPYLCQTLVKPIKLFQWLLKSHLLLLLTFSPVCVFHTWHPPKAEQSLAIVLVTQRLCTVSVVYWVSRVGNPTCFMLEEGHKAMGRPERAEHQQGESKKLSYSNVIPGFHSRLLSCWSVSKLFLGGCMRYSASPLQLSSSDHSCTGGSGKRKACTTFKSPNGVCCFLITTVTLHWCSKWVGIGLTYCCSYRVGLCVLGIFSVLVPFPAVCSI